MKKCFFLLLSLLLPIITSAQTSIFVWLNGEYTKVQNVDSVTFAKPAEDRPNWRSGHEYVDLGLPSGLLWATCNVGANQPTEYGDYFAWGETSPKEKYDISTYKLCNGTYFSFKKYCYADTFGIVDSIYTLLPADDAATVNWGSSWRMPTHHEQEELVEGCDWKWTADYNESGVAGRIGTSKTNGNTIFIPASGYYGTLKTSGDNINDVGVNGYLWSSTLDGVDAYDALNHYFIKGTTGWGAEPRCDGLCVRAVTEK